MKKYFFVLIVLALFFTSTAIAETEGEYLYLASYDAVSFIPQSISTGDVVNVTVDISNRGTYIDITDLNAELLLDSGLEAINTTYQIESIKPGVTKKLTFEIKVNENALPGNYHTTLNMTYKRLGEEVKQQQVIIIPIIKTEKKVDISVSPSIISPGSKETLVFKITNLTNQPISNLSFSWEEANNLILPLGSDNKRFVPYLEAKETATITYPVAVDPNIVTGIYPLSATTTMNDNNGITTQNSTIGLIIGGDAEFEVSVDTSDTLLSINIANIGTNNAESVVVKVSGTGLSIKNNTQIIGNLERGDYTVASFETTQLNAKEINVEISYTDTTGERQKNIKTISLGADTNNFRTNGYPAEGTFPTGTTGQTGMPGNFRGRTQPSFPTTEVAIIIIVIIVGVVCYKKRNLIRGKIKKIRK